MKILIAVDGSAAAQRAVGFAARLAVPLASADVTLLYVRPSHTGALVTLGAPGPNTATLLDLQLDRVEREILDEAAEVLGDIGVRPHQRIETGTPAAAVCRVAAEGEFDLIVLGSRGHSELKSMFTGSTTTAVVHGAPCSVLVVR